jgi:putative transposase
LVQRCRSRADIRAYELRLTDEGSKTLRAVEPVARRIDARVLDALPKARHQAFVLAYYQFPEEHWRRIRTNNPLERILREIRRRTRVVGAFPDGESALNLAAARLRHIAGSEWSTKRYLSMEVLKDQQQNMITA